MIKDISNNLCMQLLVSTMYQTDYSLLNKIGIESDVIVINQCNENSEKIFSYEGYQIIWVNTTDRGLSRSRNKAIQYATADICLLVDDDEVLCSGYKKIIIDAFCKYPAISVIGFQVKGIESEFKIYSAKECKVGYIRSLRMSSVEIAFVRKHVVDKRIMFDEKIGAGTKYMKGEENSFLYSCLRNHLKIYYIPKLISYIHMSESTWFRGFNSSYLYASGAAFTSMSRTWSIFLILQFAIRKRTLFKGIVSPLKMFFIMMQGRKDYLSES